MHNICIFAPQGGFGYHVRWMALLDNQFQKAGEHQTTSEKVKYILDEVYNKSAADWLIKEDQHDNGPFGKLGNYIYFNHQLDNESRIVRLKNQQGQRLFEYSDATKILCCTCDSQIALKSYRALNPNLNYWTEEEFLERIGIDNMLALTTPMYHPNTSIINNDILYYGNILDRTYYRTLITHLQLDDNYQAAAAIHFKWWTIHREAEEAWLDPIYREKLLKHVAQARKHSRVGKTLEQRSGRDRRQ